VLISTSAAPKKGICINRICKDHSAITTELTCESSVALYVCFLSSILARTIYRIWCTPTNSHYTTVNYVVLLQAYIDDGWNQTISTQRLYDATSINCMRERSSGGVSFVGSSPSETKSFWTCFTVNLLTPLATIVLSWVLLVILPFVVCSAHDYGILLLNMLIFACWQIFFWVNSTQTYYRERAIKPII
jgi:hypothetical protein